MRRITLNSIDSWTKNVAPYGSDAAARFGDKRLRVAHLFFVRPLQSAEFHPNYSGNAIAQPPSQALAKIDASRMGVMIRTYLSAALVLAGSLVFAVPSASASSIFFSWDPSDPFNPSTIFRLENGSPSALADFFVDLRFETGPDLQIAFLTEVDLDGDGTFEITSVIPAGITVQTTQDLFGLGITNAYLRSSGGTVVLLDVDGNPLPDGLTFEESFAEVQFAPVPEPGTLLLLGTGVAAVLIKRRRQSAR